MPVTLTALPAPTCLSAKLALVDAAVTVSPASLSVARVTVALAVPSYGLSTPVALTVRSRAVMLAGAEDRGVGKMGVSPLAPPNLKPEEADGFPAATRLVAEDAAVGAAGSAVA